MKTFILKVVKPDHQYDQSTFIVDAWNAPRAITQALKTYCGWTNVRTSPRWSNVDLWSVERDDLTPLCDVQILYTHPTKMNRTKAIDKMIEITK
jgi:hypothetical protein